LGYEENFYCLVDAIVLIFLDKMLQIQLLSSLTRWIL